MELYRKKQTMILRPQGIWESTGFIWTVQKE